MGIPAICVIVILTSSQPRMMHPSISIIGDNTMRRYQLVTIRGQGIAFPQSYMRAMHLSETQRTVLQSQYTGKVSEAVISRRMIFSSSTYAWNKFRLYSVKRQCIRYTQVEALHCFHSKMNDFADSEYKYRASTKQRRNLFQVQTRTQICRLERVRSSFFNHSYDK